MILNGQVKIKKSNGTVDPEAVSVMIKIAKGVGVIAMNLVEIKEIEGAEIEVEKRKKRGIKIVVVIGTEPTKKITRGIGIKIEETEVVIIEKTKIGGIGIDIEVVVREPAAEVGRDIGEARILTTVIEIVDMTIYQLTRDDEMIGITKEGEMVIGTTEGECNIPQEKWIDLVMNLHVDLCMIVQYREMNAYIGDKNKNCYGVGTKTMSVYSFFYYQMF